MADPIVAAPAADTSVTPAAPPATPVSTTEPTFLQDRLERAKKTVLKELGIKVKKGEDPQAKLDEYKADLDSKKVERKELRDKIAAHEASIEKLSASQAAVQVFAEVEFNLLTPAQQAIVKTAAGDDAGERLKAIAMLKATAPATAPVIAEAPPAAPPAEAPPIPPPAQTAPPAAAPAPTSSQPSDVRAEHARLKETHPLLAAAYLLANRFEYYKQK